MTLLHVLQIIFAWAFMSTVFVGIGLLVEHIAGCRTASVFARFWLGWALTLVVLQLAQLVRPVDWILQLCAIGLGIAGLVLGRARVSPPTRSWRWSPREALAIGVTFAVAAFAARHALVPSRSYDTGTYHLPVVMWLNRYPLVTGLGNLHVRLAFNNSVSLYQALMNVGIFPGLTLNLSLGLLASALAAELAWTGITEAGWRRAPALAAAALLALPLIVSRIYAIDFEGLSPDLAAYCCGIELGLLMLTACVRPDAPSSFREGTWLALIVLAAVACTVKLSMAPFAAGVLVWTVLIVPPPGRRAVMTATLVSGVALTTWVGRSIVLSGYPFFPWPSFPIGVAWRIPLETARQNYGWIRAWARLVQDHSMRVPFEQVLSSWAWLRPWIAGVVRDSWGVVLPIGACVAALIALAAVRLLRQRVTLRLAGAMLVPAFGIGFWFLFAPDVRFAGALFVLCAMFAWATLVDAAAGTPALARCVAAVVCALTVAAAGKQSVTMWTWWRAWPEAVAFGRLPAPQTLLFRTHSGDQLWVPAEGETCWAAPIPCTPYPSGLLEFNRPRDPSSGFRVSPFRDDVVVGWWTASRPWDTMKPK